ncbi:hypothetical protein [Phascolarctobacterium succinatutens]|uniref:Uncharacterized protein n=1 Tax=Phascolarctobacterium succinatutens TaxID=626940 RepID=A0A1Q6RAF1_9FIRM|nr:hypothetical protein [Phascolarctobacterium succinatutens]OLA39357.1 MAG: hypothetical protein BHW43_00215 [Phascolarctobacterium succinatutens]
MYIKTKSGDYVNSKNIGALKIKYHGGDFKVVADCISYCGEPCFYTSVDKEAAQAYMNLMVKHLDEVEQAATMQYPRCAILKVSESTVDAMRYSYRNRPLQNEPQHAASKNTKLSAMLTALVDDFAASGDSDNLLKINAYIRMYFQQEANHE